MQVGKVIVFFAPFHARLSVCSNYGLVSIVTVSHVSPNIAFQTSVCFLPSRSPSPCATQLSSPSRHARNHNHTRSIGRVDLLPTREKHILCGHFVSHFSLRRDPPRQRRARCNHDAHNCCVRSPVVRLSVPATRWGPDVFRVWYLAASTHCCFEG